MTTMYVLLQVRDTFSALTTLILAPTAIQDIVSCAQPFNYRNKMIFTASPTGYGLHHYSGNQLVPVHFCHLQDAVANAILQQVAA